MKKEVALVFIAVFVFAKEDIKNYKLEETRIEIELDDTSKYNSSATINKEFLKANPSGNGDIGSILRTLPNIQFDNSQLKSSTPGEIDPAKVSISGGLHYQNNFMLDGVNMNNDLDPAGTGSWIGNAPGRSQGIAIDTSLLESIKVQDSNIGAAYGGFTGGVVEAQTRRPQKDFGADISYQITQGKANGGLDFKDFLNGSLSLTNYHLYKNQDKEEFINSYDDSNQPNFIKHLARMSLESKINDKFSLIGSITSTISIIPLRRSDDTYKGNSGAYQSSPIDPDDSATAKQNQRREIYNYFIKGYYDMSENLKIEFGYTYAPQYDYRFMVGTKGDYYSFTSGGHQASSKISWYNSFGFLTNTLSYSQLENSAETNFSATKYWQISDSKRWSNWANWVRSGGQAPSKSTQRTLTNTISQEFTPFELGLSLHTITTGLELSYQYSDFKFSKPYDSAVKTQTFMTQAQQALCQNTDMSWCDTAKAYDVRGFESYAYTQNPAPFEIGIMSDGRKYLIWKYGQWIDSITRFDDKRKISVSNKALAYFLQDDIAIKFKGFGTINVRGGLRFDYDTYMSKFTSAPRFSLSYVPPWSNRGGGINTQLTFGLNRYYGRNITGLALSDGMNSLRKTLYRSSPDKSWEDINKECEPYVRSEIKRRTYTDPLTGKQMTQSYRVYYNALGQEIKKTDCYEISKNSTKFDKLKVPYVDEFMAGLQQDFMGLKFETKYIYRENKDDIRQVRSDYRKLPKDERYADTYYTYTNEGKAWTNVITFSAQNTEPFKFLGAENFLLLAFDFTNVKRNYVDYTEVSRDMSEDELIVYNGELIHSSQRPASNFVRPYTLRLTGMHLFEFGRNTYILNNFFRFRSSYNAIALISLAGRTPSNSGIAASQYKEEYKAYAQYGKYKIPAAFSWDMRVGVERKIFGKHSLYVNIDIFNILDTKNTTINTQSYTGYSYNPSLGYEVGRQFWLQVGYKY